MQSTAVKHLNYYFFLISDNLRVYRFKKKNYINKHRKKNKKTPLVRTILFEYLRMNRKIKHGIITKPTMNVRSFAVLIYAFKINYKFIDLSQNSVYLILRSRWINTVNVYELNLIMCYFYRIYFNYYYCCVTSINVTAIRRNVNVTSRNSQR